MLIKALFQSKGHAKPRVFSTEAIQYMDESGVLFAAQSHALWAAGEWGKVQLMLQDIPDGPYALLDTAKYGADV